MRATEGVYIQPYNLHQA